MPLRTSRVNVIVFAATFVVGALILYAWNRYHHSHEAGQLESVSKQDLKRVSQPATVTGERFRTSKNQIDPTATEWPTEVFVDEAGTVLSRLKKITKADTELQSADVGSLFTIDFEVTLPTSAPRQIYSNEGLTAWRYELTDMQRVGKLEGVTRFFSALVPYRSGAEINLMKIVGVEISESQANTIVRVESRGSEGSKGAQLIQTWTCSWQLRDDFPQLRSAELTSGELVESSSDFRFRDKTLSILGRELAFEKQLRHGLHHWLGRLDSVHGVSYFSKFGLSVADVNGDGLDDLYVCQPGALPNRLFLQQPDGTAVEQAATFGIDLLDQTPSALFVDLDNDGDQDLAAATFIGVLIYENKQNRRFEKRLTLPMPDVDLQGLSAADYDNDGDLDLYQIVDYASDKSRSTQGLPAFVYHNANDGGTNHLFRNDIAGDRWRFEDVTRQAGLHINNHRHSLAAAWQDYDSDGDQDLYVANDYGQNCLYENDDGSFTDVANTAGVVDFGSGMSAAWGRL